MPTYTYQLLPSFGASRTGNAANIVAKVYDSTGTLQATVNSSWTEQVDGSSNAVTGAYRNTTTLNTTWLPVEIRYTITGVAGVFAQETVVDAPPATLVTAIMQDTTAGNYTVAGSYGQSVFTGHAPGTANGSAIVGSAMGIAPNSIDVPQLSSTLMQLLSRRLTLTGVTSPVTADTYQVYGFYNDSVYYKSTTLGTPMYVWNNGSGYTISTTVGTNGSGYFTTPGSVNGVWTAQGTATGTPAAVAHGNAVLSAFQPDHPELSSTGVTTSYAIKKNTPLANFEFPMFASGTNTPTASLAVTGTVSIDGVDFVNLTNAVSGVSNGLYKVNLAAADTNGNVITLRFTATGCDPTLITIPTQS